MKVDIEERAPHLSSSPTDGTSGFSKAFPSPWPIFFLLTAFAITLPPEQRGPTPRSRCSYLRNSFLRPVGSVGIERTKLGLCSCRSELFSRSLFRPPGPVNGRYTL